MGLGRRPTKKDFDNAACAQIKAYLGPLAQGCKIILADEPTGNLDSTNTRNIVEILRSLAHDDGCTVIIVTHDPAVAEQADIVLQMKDGSWI